MSGSQIPKRMRQKGTWDLGRDGSPKCRLRKTTAELRQMSGSQIPKRIRQKWTSAFSGTWALGQGWTGRISQMPPQENDCGFQANVQISNTKEDKAKVDKSIFRDLDLRQMSGSQIPKRIRQKGTSTLYLPNAKGKCPKYFNNDFRNLIDQLKLSLSDH